jgi:hypothetical protein
VKSLTMVNWALTEQGVPVKTVQGTLRVLSVLVV